MSTQARQQLQAWPDLLVDVAGLVQLRHGRHGRRREAVLGAARSPAIRHHPLLQHTAGCHTARARAEIHRERGRVGSGTQLGFRTGQTNRSIQHHRMPPVKIYQTHRDQFASIYIEKRSNLQKVTCPVLLSFFISISIVRYIFISSYLYISTLTHTHTDSQFIYLYSFRPLHLAVSYPKRRETYRARQLGGIHFALPDQVLEEVFGCILLGIFLAG